MKGGPRRHVVVSLRATGDEVRRWKADAFACKVGFAPWVRDALTAWARMAVVDKVVELPDGEIAKRVAEDAAAEGGEEVGDGA